MRRLSMVSWKAYQQGTLSVFCLFLNSFLQIFKIVLVQTKEVDCLRLCVCVCVCVCKWTIV
jgi:hypothetical protein